MKLTRGANMTTQRHARATITFDGTAGGGEAATDVTIFTITGRVWITGLTTFCTSTLTESGATATISMGTANTVASLRNAQNAVNIITNDWVTSSGSSVQGGERQAVNTFNDGEGQNVSEDVVYAPAVTNITGGVIVVDVWYIPITDNGALS